MKPFFHADQVGSLLRTQRLHDARKRWTAGAITRDALRAIEDAEIAALVRAQESVGLKAVTDGEYRRENWWIDFIRRIPGVAITQPDAASTFTGGHVPLGVAITGKIRWAEPNVVGDYAFLRAAAKAEPKITIPSPSRIHFHGGDAAFAGVYASPEAFWADVAAYYQAEITALEAAGCRYVQIDDPVMSYFVDDAHRDKMRARGIAPDAPLRKYVDVINACVAKRAPGTYLSLHICRGNARSSWVATGGYARLAETVFPNLDVDAYFLEYDDDRSGDFAPLALIPRGRKVVVGLLTSKRAALEPSDALKRRLDEAARIVPLADLALSPQCGFASTEEGNLLTEQDQWRKLELCVRLAEEVWGRA
jgi:5-methyltetrahydropteroyltriglutamate--homocysteine methyltransferase